MTTFLFCILNFFIDSFMDDKWFNYSLIFWVYIKFSGDFYIEFIIDSIPPKLLYYSLLLLLLLVLKLVFGLVSVFRNRLLAFFWCLDFLLLPIRTAYYWGSYLEVTLLWPEETFPYTLFKTASFFGLDTHWIKSLPPWALYTCPPWFLLDKLLSIYCFYLILSYNSYLFFSILYRVYKSLW